MTNPFPCRSVMQSGMAPGALRDAPHAAGFGAVGAHDVITSRTGTSRIEAERIMPSHEAQCALAYSPEQLFDLAADVENYPEFLPWWIAARIRSRAGDVYYTEQIVGFGTFRARFGTKTLLDRPERIVVSSTDGTFRKFDLEWVFESLPDNGCRVALRVDLELRSKLAQALFNRAIAHSVASIMSAFEARAHRIYRPATSEGATERNGDPGTPAI